MELNIYAMMMAMTMVMMSMMMVKKVEKVKMVKPVKVVIVMIYYYCYYYVSHNNQQQMVRIGFSLISKMVEVVVDKFYNFHDLSDYHRVVATIIPYTYHVVQDIYENRCIK